MMRCVSPTGRPEPSNVALSWCRLAGRYVEDRMSSSRVQITFTGPFIAFETRRRFHRVVVLQSPPKSAAHQSHIDFDLIGIKSNRRRDRVAAILRNLRRRPQLALGPLKMGRAISRLHRVRAP